MHILLTNDDGIFAPGLAAIYKEICEMGEVSVVAPAASQSGAGHRVTFYGPVVCNRVDIEGLFSGHSVEGSPADCVKLGIMKLLKKPVDLVISGMNSGANVGVNIFYSGTVAAAMEGAFFKIPAVALSLAWEDEMDYPQGAHYCAMVLKKLLPLTAEKVININIPQLSKGRPKGIRIVPQSTEGFDEEYVSEGNGKGQTVHQLTGGLHRDDAKAGTDTNALAQGYITITALQPDMTNYQQTMLLEQIQFNLNGDTDDQE
ncbi:MAG: 5'/3'-nucleotidase SurE [Planctomycetota bacterium]